MWRRLQQEIWALFFDEDHAEAIAASRVRRFLHFWVVVGKGFTRSRCPVRASALAYSSLLAFIPLFAVVIGIATGVLKGERDRIKSDIDLVLTNLVPQIKENPDFLDMKNKIVAYTWDGIDKVNSGTIGTSGALALLTVIIFMLARVEETLNDIWGVSQGRSWYARVVNYWAAISLGPVIILAAISFTAALRLERTEEYLSMLPFIGSFLLKLAPVPIVGGAFALFYALVPNTKVQWRAALVGGLTAAVLWHLLNQTSFLFVSQVNRNSKIFGTLVPIPVFMAGMYFSWLLLLFGSQVAYSYQNRKAHFTSRQSDRVHQDGCELVAVRVMVEVGRSFVAGRDGPSLQALSERLEVPTELIGRVVGTLLRTHLVVESSGSETGLAPGRPLAQIRVSDILTAMRRGVGQRLATRADESRALTERELESVRKAEEGAGVRTLEELLTTNVIA